jgi:IS5 family transposase
LVDAKNKLLKKKKDEALKLKTDSYTVETDVHFPTHLNLLWDGCRKCLDMVKKLQDISVGSVEGWRKIKSIRKTLKSQFLLRHKRYSKAGMNIKKSNP